ncbi:hypothetical protein Dimus_015033 [Dionaea muscipula]
MKQKSQRDVDAWKASNQSSPEIEHRRRIQQDMDPASFHHPSRNRRRQSITLTCLGRLRWPCQDRSENQILTHLTFASSPPTTQNHHWEGEAGTRFILNHPVFYFCLCKCGLQIGGHSLF